MYRIFGSKPSAELTGFLSCPGYTGGNSKRGAVQKMILTVMLFSGLVTLFLLMAASQTAIAPVRALLSAALGGLYAGACMIPSFSFFGGSLWRLCSLLVIGSISFGIRKEGMRQSLLFVILQLTVTGLLSAADSPLVSLLLLVGFGLFIFLKKRKNTVSVVIEHQNKNMTLLAWKDTGNTLKDPLTAQPVLIVDAAAAEELTGLTPKQLNDPVGTMTQGIIPGLRLIPYHTIDRPDGMLLGLYIEQIRIGGRKKSAVVAFAPTNFGQEGNIRALIGGSV